MDEKKLLFKDSKVRLKAPKQGVQSKSIWFLELYISGSTNLTKVGFYRLQGLKKNFACTSQLIVKALMQAVKLSSTEVTRLLF